MTTAALALGAITFGLFIGGDVQGGSLAGVQMDDPVFKRPGCGMNRLSPLSGHAIEVFDAGTEFPISRRVQIPDSSLSFRFPRDLELESEEELSAGESSFEKISTYMAESSNCVAVVTVSKGNEIDLSSEAILLACSAAIVEGLREEGFMIEEFEQGQEKLDSRKSIWMKMKVDDGNLSLRIRVRLIEDDRQLAVTTILSLPLDRHSESVADEAFESIRFWKGQ